MNLRKLMLGLLIPYAVVTAVPAAATIINPTPQRAYVSMHGSDTHNCGAEAPCRTFARALTQVQPDGEVLVLNSGDYGTMTITQGVTIIAPPGVYAGISGSSGNGITINAPDARVRLVGLTINGVGINSVSVGGANGINVLAAASVDIERVDIANFIGGEGNGVRAVDVTTQVNIRGSHLSNNKVGVAASNGPTLNVIDSGFVNNLGGIALSSDSGTGPTTLVLKGSSIIARGSYGVGATTLHTSDSVKAVIADCLISVGSATEFNDGVVAISWGGGPIAIAIGNSRIANNNRGIYLLGTGATVKADKNEFADNNYGVYNGSGTYASVGNNVFLDNGYDVFGAETSIAYGMH